MNLAALFEQGCRTHGLRPAFGVKLGGEWWWVAYAELLPMVDGLRGGLASLGVGNGDAVAMVSNNRLEWVVACYATVGLGAAFVPISEAQAENEWRAMLADSRAGVAIGATPAICATLAEVPTLAHVVRLAAPRDGTGSYGALVEAGQRRPVAVRPADRATRAVLLYAGTAAAQRVDLTHGDVIAGLEAMRARVAVTPDDRSLALLPWTHAHGQVCELHTLLSAGASVAINDDASTLAANLADTQPTLLFGDAGIFARLREQIASPPGWLRRCIAAVRPRSGRAAPGQPFGGRLRCVIGDVTAVAPPLAEHLAEVGVRVCALQDEAWESGGWLGSVAGCWLLVVGCWLLGCQPLG